MKKIMGHERRGIMTKDQILQILNDTAYIRTGGTGEELRCAEYLQSLCEKMEVEAHLEPFPVQMAAMKKAVLIADGREIPCKGYFCCGSGEAEAPLYYMPNQDPVSIAGAKDKIVLLDTGIGYFTFQDLCAAGVKGIITYDGNVHYEVRDIDQKELRAYVACGRKLPCVNINALSALELRKSGVERVRIQIEQEEYEGESRNVVAQIPGRTDEFITFTAHYDSTSLSQGAYDNMTGCIGLLSIMEVLKESAPNRYGLKFIFCGSEERGLLGSKAWTEKHQDELEKCVLNINLDMLGCVMGKFLACCTSEDKLSHYIAYRASVLGVGIRSYQGVYSSDSTPFADHGVPAVSFARMAGSDVAPFHNRYDTLEEVDPDQLIEDMEFVTFFADDMANASLCPVKREIPEKVKKELDEYLNRKRKD